MINRLVVVLGGNGEVGKELIAEAVNSGATVIGITRNNKQNLFSENKNFTQIQCDLSTEKNFDDLYKKISSLNPEKIDWIQATGHFTDYLRIDETANEDILNQVEANLTSTILGVKMFTQLMKKIRNGNFICFSSVSIGKAFPFMAVFNATKAGIEELIATVSSEVLFKEVTYNCLRLSTIKTPIEIKLKPHGDQENWFTPKDVAISTFDFINSLLSNKIRGATLPLYKPSTTYFHDSLTYRFEKTPDSFLKD